MDLFQQDTNNNNSKGVSYTTGFFLLIGIAFVGFALSSIIGAALLLSKAGTAQAINDVLKDPDNADLLKIIQTFSVLLSMLIPAWLVANMLNRKPFQLLGFRKEVQLKQIALLIAIMFVSVFVAGALGYLTKEMNLFPSMKAKFDQLEKSYGEQVEMMVNLKSFGGYIMSIFLMAFLPALCEEALFRGGLQNFLTRATRKPWLAIIIVSILFSLVHFSYYGFLPRMFLGIVLGSIFYITGNLWLSVTAHFLNNALAVTQAYVLTQQGKGLKEVMDQETPGLYWGLLGIPVLVLLFSSLRKISRQNRFQPDSNNFTHGI